jgi:regulator of chromosome condensation
VGVGRRREGPAGHRIFAGRSHARRTLAGFAPQRVILGAPSRRTASITSGPEHSFTLDARDGAVWAWGLNTFGQAGADPRAAGSPTVAVPTPTRVPGLKGGGRRHVHALTGGQDHSVAILEGGGPCLVWGRIDGGQLGVRVGHDDDSNDNDRLEEEDEEARSSGPLVRRDARGRPRICLRPVPVPGVGAAAAAACGTGHTNFIDSEGRAYGAGYGSLGQLGIASEDDAEVATRITGTAVKGKKLVWFGAGGNFSMVATPVG